jgi:flagellar basal-body rod protein FlgG
MLRGLYTAGTAMLAQNRRMDVISNNLTNVETPGFKSDLLITQSFRDMMISRLNDPSVYQYSYVGPHNTGIHIDTIQTSFDQGPLLETQLGTDLALEGDAFFVVEYTPMTLIKPDPEDAADPDYEPEYELGEETERYTRAGNFHVDSEGFLVNSDGYYVLGENGRIEVLSDQFTVDATGMISIINEDGEIEEVDQLLLAKFEDPSILRKTGTSLFLVPEILDEDGDPIDVEWEQATNVLVRQSYLEGSNVDTAKNTVDMISTYRAYEINQRILQIVDESLGRAVNDIASF